MASILEEFDGTGDLDGSSPGTLSGVSYAVWTAGAGFAGDGTVVMPTGAAFVSARLEMDGSTPAHSSAGGGVTVIEAAMLPGGQLRVSLDFDSELVGLAALADGSGQYMSNGTLGAISAGGALVGFVKFRIEITTSAVRYYINNALVHTRGTGIASGLPITEIRLGYPGFTGTSGYADGSSQAALDYLALETQTTSGPLGSSDPAGMVSAEGPLGQAALLAILGREGRIAAPGPLGAARIIGEHDFTPILEAAGAFEFYTCEIIDGATTLTVPISSWQGTLQLDGSGYLQAVIPAVQDLADALNALTASAEFVIYRCARLSGVAGAVVRNEMARSPIEQLQLDQGPQRYTATVSGYSAEVAAPAEGEAPPVRVLTGLRSVSTGTSGTRVRCAINWFLRPGGPAAAGGVELVADYINWYAGGGDAYMDVGERA